DAARLADRHLAVPLDLALHKPIDAQRRRSDDRPFDANARSQEREDVALAAPLRSARRGCPARLPATPSTHHASHSFAPKRSSPDFDVVPPERRPKGWNPPAAA